MRRALVLSGGGARGAFEVGAAHYLICEAGLDFQVFLGSSVGALNSSILSMARNYPELVRQAQNLQNFWEEIRGNRSIYLCNPWSIFGLFRQHALYNPVGLRRLIQKYLGSVQFSKNTSKYSIVTSVAIETGELFHVDSRNPALSATFADYVLASASMPPFFPPVYINGKHWYDGGLRDVTPLARAFKEKPDEIYVILTFPVNQKWEPISHPVGFGGVIQSLLRIITIMTSEISANDLQIARLINQYPRIFTHKRSIPIHLIAPSTVLHGGTLEFNPAYIRTNIGLGSQTARHYLRFVREEKSHFS